MSDGFLHRYFLNNADKRLHKWMHYFDIYERHFSRFRQRAPVMIEIGVFGGGSLAMWKAFFGEGARIIGIDINPQCKVHEADGIEIFIGSQDDPELIERIFSKHPRVDIVLDDGSHVMEHMISSFELLYSRLHPHGVYVVEDTHTCYWPEYQGGLRQPGSFMEFTKDKLDEINAVHSRGALSVSDFTKATDCIACYDSVVVFERRPQGKRQAPATQAMGDT
ncbi:MAG: class I SAM-dependent methyltransferase [Burkholderiales bacterium]|nr:class I SAM-dependent methyltransferase [Burkholderiales bacterium]